MKKLILALAACFIFQGCTVYGEAYPPGGTITYVQGGYYREVVIQGVPHRLYYRAPPGGWRYWVAPRAHHR